MQNPIIVDEGWKHFNRGIPGLNETLVKDLCGWLDPLWKRDLFSRSAVILFLCCVAFCLMGCFKPAKCLCCLYLSVFMFSPSEYSFWHCGQVFKSVLDVYSLCIVVSSNTQITCWKHLIMTIYSCLTFHSGLITFDACFVESWKPFWSCVLNNMLLDILIAG